MADLTITTPIDAVFASADVATFRTNLGLGGLAVLSAAPAGTLTGATLAAGVTASSLTSVGTIATGVWQGTAVADSYIASAATWNAKQSAITFGTGVQTALGVNIGSAGAPVLFNGAGGTPSSLVGTNITGTAAAFNINGTVGATTPATGAFTTGLFTGGITSIGSGSHSITNSGNNEMLIQTNLASLNVLAVRNTATDGYSAYTCRDSVGEQFVFGHGNSTTEAFWAGWNYIESWNGTLVGAPTPFQIALNGDYGSGWGHYRRMSFDAAGTIKLYKLESGTTPTAAVTVATTGLVTFAEPIGVGVTAASNAAVFASGTRTATGTAAYAFVTTNALTAAANNDSLHSFATFPEVAKGAFTGLTYYGIRLGVPSFTGGGTLADYYGIFVGAPTDGTNRYGLRIDNIAGGTLNYAIYTGTGIVFIGSATEATTGGAGSIITLGGIYATKKIISATDITALGVLELGAASDTTLARVSAGVISVEGVTVATASNTLTLTGKSLSADQLTAGVLGANITLGESTGQIILDPTLSTDGTWSGLMQAGTAGATLAFGDLVYFQASDSRWELVDADAESTSGPLLLGMCVLAAASDGSATNILLYGKIRADANFPALTIGAPVYASTTAGDIQVAQPSGTDDVIRVVGHAITADAILFNPSQDWIIHT